MLLLHVQANFNILWKKHVNLTVIYVGIHVLKVRISITSRNGKTSTESAFKQNNNNLFVCQCANNILMNNRLTNIKKCIARKQNRPDLKPIKYYSWKMKD